MMNRDNWTNKEQWIYVGNFISDMYEDDDTVSSQEFEGFRTGILLFLNNKNDRIPQYTMNIRVEAVKEFDRIAQASPDIIVSTEFYSGFIKGFCSACSIL